MREMCLAMASEISLEKLFTNPEGGGESNRNRIYVKLADRLMIVKGFTSKMSLQASKHYASAFEAANNSKATQGHWMGWGFPKVIFFLKFVSGLILQTQYHLPGLDK
jgi:hypothetical protein